MQKISIVIPTYNHLDDCLKPCIESIQKYTDFTKYDIEIIIVNNGSNEETNKYLGTLPTPYFKTIWFHDAIGYTKASNFGIMSSSGDFVVLLNNDTVILGENWLDMLISPFSDVSVGITGPCLNYCPHAKRNFLIFFCVMIRKEMFNKIGRLDEIFSPGFGEDTDFCAKIENLGYKLVQVPNGSLFIDKEQNRLVGNFPIFHAGEKTFSEVKDVSLIIERNSKILKDRYDPMKHFFHNIQGWFSFPNLYLAMTKLYPSGSRFVEIGSYKGQSSSFMAVEIANSQKDIKFYCIDTWLGSDEKYHKNDETVKNGQLYETFLKSIEPAKHYIIPIRKTSEEASKDFEDNSLDFIFIDAAHDYENVINDLKCWFPKLKKNGHIAGHDFSDRWPWVKKAVIEFFEGKALDVGEGCWCYFNE